MCTNYAAESGGTASKDVSVNQLCVFFSSNFGDYNLKAQKLFQWFTSKILGDLHKYWVIYYFFGGKLKI